MEKKTNNSQKNDMPLGTWNYKVIAAGFAVVILGFILMAGGGSDDPNVFDESIYDFRHITLAPIVVLLGYIGIAIGIVRKQKDSE